MRKQNVVIPIRRRRNFGHVSTAVLVDLVETQVVKSYAYVSSNLCAIYTKSL